MSYSSEILSSISRYIAMFLGKISIDSFQQLLSYRHSLKTFRTAYVHVLMDLSNGDLVAAGAIYCAVKRAVCSMAH